MAGNLTNEGEALALNLLFRNAGAPPINVYLGLATSAIGDADTLSTITEESDIGYSRQEIYFAAPAQVNGKGTIKNNNEIFFGPYNANANNPVTYAFITDVSSGSSGTLITWIELPESKQPLAGENLRVPVNDLIQDID